MERDPAWARIGGVLPLEIHNEHGERIACTLTPGDVGGRDLVVIGHGLTSDKTRPWSEGLSAGLQERGIASLRIAFSGNGESGGDFLDSNITKEVSDLGCVLDALGDLRVHVRVEVEVRPFRLLVL